MIVIRKGKEARGWYSSIRKVNLGGNMGLWKALIALLCSSDNEQTLDLERDRSLTRENQLAALSEVSENEERQ